MTDVSLENIDFSYRDKRVLHAFSCTFASAGFHAILGPNGSGKTTLLDIISGFVSPVMGTVCLDGININTFSKRALSRRISVVTQQYDINFPFSVREVILMGRYPYIGRFSTPGDTDISKVDEIMEITGITHLRDCRITEVSGGERQRCVFARALCQDTPVLILDEAFSNMDICYTLQLLNLLRSQVRKKNKTIIAVLHDLNLASEYADTMTFIKDGTLKVHGRSEEVFTRENIERIFNVTTEVTFNEFTQARQVSFKI